MNNSSKTFSKQGVQQSVLESWYNYEDYGHTYENVQEWAEEHATHLWENRNELEEDQDEEGEVTLEDYKEWAKDMALSLEIDE